VVDSGVPEVGVAVGLRIFSNGVLETDVELVVENNWGVPVGVKKSF
jgi:hypothetical protein